MEKSRYPKKHSPIYGHELNRWKSNSRHKRKRNEMHYTVLVRYKGKIRDANEVIAELMEPYDENREVPTYIEKEAKEVRKEFREMKKEYADDTRYIAKFEEFRNDIKGWCLWWNGDELDAKGIVLEDKAGGTTWKVK